MNDLLQHDDSILQGALIIIDWDRLENIFLKKAKEPKPYLTDTDKEMLRNYVSILIKSGAVLWASSAQDANENTINNLIAQSKEVDFKDFCCYLELQQLPSLLKDELRSQLDPWQSVFKAKSQGDYIKRISICQNEETLNQHILKIFNPNVNPSSHLKKKGFSNFIKILILIIIIISFFNFKGNQKISKSFTVIKKNMPKIFFNSIKNKCKNFLVKFFNALIIPGLRLFVYYSASKPTTEKPRSYTQKFIQSIIKKRNISIYFYFYGRILFDIGRSQDALILFCAAAFWGYRGDVLWYIAKTSEASCEYFDAELAYRGLIFFTHNISPQTFLNLGHVLLAMNKEKEAFRLISRAIKLYPKFSMAHQNMAAHYDYNDYSIQPLDVLYDSKIILYSAYNIIGERAVQNGKGEIGVEFYGKAIQIQKEYGADQALPKEIISKLVMEYDINPNQPIRILPYEWVTLIGHIAMLDSYIKLQRLGMANENCQILLLAPKNKVPNLSYLNLWRSHVKVIEDPMLINFLFPYQRYFGDCFNGYLKPNNRGADWTELAAQGQIEWDKKGYGNLISLPSELDKKGWDVLEKWGLKKTDWFVGLHIRGAGYHRENKYSIQSHRDAIISDYLEAIAAITSRGGWVIRMGDPSMEPLPVMERVIDYVHTQYKSSCMDIFLAARAKFYIGTTSGLTNVVISLGTPCLLVNCISNYFQLWNNKVLFMIKLLWSEDRKRFLTLSEMTHDSLRWKIFNINQLKSMGIYPYSNTSDEIYAATTEILGRLDGRNAFAETNADRVLRAECERSGNRFYFGNARLSESFWKKRGRELSMMSQSVESLITA